MRFPTWHGPILTVALFLSLVGSQLDSHRIAGPTAAGASGTRRTPESVKLPLDFVENRGQWDEPTRFAARLGALAARFEKEAIRLHHEGIKGPPLTLSFENASRKATLVGEHKRAGVYHYYVGHDPARRQTGVPAYGSLVYRNLYDGIDVRVEERSGRIEYELTLSPGADPRQAVIRVEGATRLELAGDGTLLLHSEHGTLRQTPPVTWEVLPNGEPRRLESRFLILDERRYRFDVPGHNSTLAMVIDPGLEWSTFLGGNGSDWIRGATKAEDGSGDLILVGVTASTDFPAISLTAGSQSIFVTRMNAAGTALVYTTFIGISTSTDVSDVAADSTGGAAFVGTTLDLDYLTTPGAYQSAPRGQQEAVVTRLDAAGAVAFSTYVGGTARDEGLAVAVDALGSVIVAGNTFSADFPTSLGAYGVAYHAPNPGECCEGDAFVARLSADGTQLTYATYFGGQSFESVADLVVDPQGFVTMTGVTGSTATGSLMPTTPDAFDPFWNGDSDVFVARFRLDGSGAADLKYSTFLGGSNTDFAYGLTYNPTAPSQVTVVGFTWKDFQVPPEFPTTAGVIKPAIPPDPFNSRFIRNGFVSRFNFPAGGPGSLAWSTYIGGSFGDYASDAAVDATGNVAVLGGTRSHDFPTTQGAHDRTLGGPAGAAYDCFLSHISADGTQLLYSTYLGDADEDCLLPGDEGHLVALGGNRVAVAGMTGSADFPTTAGAFDASHGNPEGNDRDGFVARLLLEPDASGDVAVSAPTPAAPPNGASFPISGPVTLEWNPVPDTSGIEAYNYEISTRSDFPPLFTQFKGSVKTPLFLHTGTWVGTTFWRVQAADQAGNLSAWSAPVSFTTGVAGAPPVVSSLSLFPTMINGGGSGTGMVFLTGAAPSGGLVVRLSSGNPAVTTVPPTVTVPAGATSATFSFTTSIVTASTPVSIVAIAGLTQSATLTVEPPSTMLLTALSASPSIITGGTPATGTVTISNPAPSGGSSVLLVSSQPSVASVPVSVTVPAGATGTSFPLTTFAVAAPTTVNIAATLSGASRIATLTVNPSGTGSVTVSVLSVSPGSVTGGATATGTVTLNTAAPAGGTVVSLSSSNLAAATVPASVMVAAGASVASFTVTTFSVATTTSVTITASAGGLSRTATLSITALAPDLVSITRAQYDAGKQQLRVEATGTSSTATLQVFVTSTNALIGTLANNGGGKFGGQFVVSPNPQSLTVRSSGGGSASLCLVASCGPVTATLQGLSVSPGTVVGGNTSQGTVSLTATAPTGGAVVTLASSNVAASVPAGVTVPAGATSATFVVTTTTVATSTSVTITAAYGGATRTTTVTVTPVGAGDTVLVNRADYVASKQQLRLDATSTSASATLTVSATATGQIIGILTNNGGGRYSGQFSWPTNPVNVTVRSSLGGSGSRAVSAK